LALKKKNQKKSEKKKKQQSTFCWKGWASSLHISCATSTKFFFKKNK